MEDVTYFYRNSKAGFSTAKVFHTITNEVKIHKQIEEFYVPCHRADPISLLRNIFFVYHNRNKKGVNHITGDIHYCMLGLIGCTSILTIHDLSAVDAIQNPIKKNIRKLLWFTLPLKIADQVVCISEHTRTQLLKISNRIDIKVIYNAVDPIFKSKSKDFNENKPVVLQIGTAWNKNLFNVIHALSSLSCHLRIIGAVDATSKQLMDSYHMSYSVAINLTDEEIFREYLNCDIVSFCSLYEGFGMPIIEGNAVGRCVVTSKLAPMDEIAAKAACFIDPNDLSSITQGFKRIISNPDYRSILINNGNQNIKRFQSPNISLAYLQLYKVLQPISK